jgi:hypothetical protein
MADQQIKSNVNTAISILASANGWITLGLTVGNLVVPLITGLITRIQQIGQGGEVVGYEIVIKADLAELDAVDKLAGDDLAAINAEFTRLGLPTVPVPPA